MGELYDQLMRGGADLLALNPSQGGWCEYIKANLPQVQYGLSTWIVPTMGEALAEGMLGPGEYCLGSYHHLLRIAWGLETNPETITRTLLVFLGHGPALISKRWALEFRAAVQNRAETARQILTPVALQECSMQVLERFIKEDGETK